MFPYLDVDFLYGKKGNIEYWKKLAGKYIRVKSEIREMADDIYGSLFKPGERVLGLKCRGTDYINGKPKNHPVQPDIEQVLKEAKRIIYEQRCDKIYFVTEDLAYYKACKAEFGDMLCVYGDDFVSYTSGSIGKMMYSQDRDKREMGMNYLMQTLLLAKCDCLCAGCVSATVGVLLMADRFDYVYLFDLGLY